ncbi:Ldh family oxidoreductase [Comamonas sp. A7-5]|uniref:Ldh family oxidoreductase n=1 Tax=Comamonas sp. A7-5 TaxID=673549 RepID=UPI0031D7C68B
MSPTLTSARAPVLKDWASQLLQKCGVQQAQAEVTAHALVRTSLRGIDTHGIARLPSYIERLRAGDFNAKAQPAVASQNGLLRCHGDDGLGQVVVDQALKASMLQAQCSAVVACSIEACGHLGALGVLLLPAVEAGFFAFLCQQTPPIMALPGAHTAAIGNNPLAFSVPVNGKPPLVFDTALSAAARGHIVDAARESGSAIPAEWALDVHGQPTTDPQAALAGMLQPMAGYKGLGLAMLVQCLAGSLCSTPPQASAVASSGSAGHLNAFLLLINPRLASSADMFAMHTDAWLQGVASSSPAARYPGERQHRCELERQREGIPIPDGLVHQLRGVSTQLGVTSPF